MKWNVFSLETVKTALEPKFVLEKVRYVTDEPLMYAPCKSNLHAL